MIVRVFNTGTSRGEAPVNYLLSDTDHTGQPRAVKPEVLDGHPATTIAVINAIDRKHKYVSGVMAFRADENPNPKEIRQLVQSFKDTMLPGLKAGQYNSLFVLHRDKGNTEIHFVVPMVQFSLTGASRRLNIHPPGPHNLLLYEAFTQVTNHQLGYDQVVADPLRAALAGADRKNPHSVGKRRATRLLTAEIVKGIKSGQFHDRESLCAWLDDSLGVTVTRQGTNYLSVRMPGAAKAMRLKGPLFEQDADYRSLLAAKSANTGTVSGKLTVPEFQEAQSRLQSLVAERHAFNVKADLTPRTLPRTRTTGSRPQMHNTSRTTKITTKEKTMSTTQTRKIIEEALTTIKQTDEERARPQISSKSQATQKMTAMRSKASSGSTPKPSTAMDAIHEIQAAIGALQLAIDAATVDISSAPDPRARRQAQERLARLLEQMTRLEQQWKLAKERQLNESPVKKFKL